MEAENMVKMNALEPQALEARLARFTQVRRSSVRGPLRGARPYLPTLGSYHQSTRIRIQRLGNQLLTDIRTVGIRGVDEVDAQLKRAVQYAARLRRVLRCAPDIGSGNAHGAKAEAIHDQIAAYADG